MDCIESMVRHIGQQKTQGTEILQGDSRPMESGGRGGVHYTES